MTEWVAFLRGVNLGKRTVKSAELKAAFEAMGFAQVKTLLASGNVLFSADADAALASNIETGLEKAFGFKIGVVLRSVAALRQMVAEDPFKTVPETADAKLYVVLLHDPVGKTIVTLPIGVPGDFDVLRVDDADVFAVAWKLPNGRYGESLDQIDRLFGKTTLATMRNWNTILKAAGL